MLPESFTPDFLRRLELFKIRSRRAFLGSRQGGHISLKRGHGIEFSDYRQYELGDNPRHIDWGLYARSERLYVKRFQEEQALSVLVIIDGSSSMFIPAEDKKWVFARDIALSLSYVALMEQDTVAVSVPGIVDTPQVSGARSVHFLGKTLAPIKKGSNNNFVLGVNRAVSRIRFPGVCVFISDFLMPFTQVQEVFNVLRAKNLDITAIQVLGPSDITPLEGVQSAVAIDSETGEEIELDLNESERSGYGLLLSRHNERIKQYFNEARISYSLALTTESLSEFFVNNLAGTGLLK